MHITLGQAQAAADMLFAEMAEGSDELDGAVRAFLALALVDLGREREALALSPGALSHDLPRCNRSLASYAADMAQRPATRLGGSCGGGTLA